MTLEPTQAKDAMVPVTASTATSQRGAFNTTGSTRSPTTAYTLSTSPGYTRECSTPIASKAIRRLPTTVQGEAPRLDAESATNFRLIPNMKAKIGTNRVETR